MSEYQLLRAAMGAGAWVVLALFLASGAVVFVSALRHLIDVAFGDVKSAIAAAGRPNSAVLIVASVMGLLLLLGLWLPPWLSDAIGRAAAATGARP